MRLTLWFLLGGLCVFLLFHASYCRIIIETDQLSRSRGQQYRGRIMKSMNGLAYNHQGREANIVSEAPPLSPVGDESKRP
ncbi:hypothetical protein I3842_16G093700 [Carya illinoinensis]|uniref:Secreted protein n=1 Tax=Carya illinoinensis TaxID=32201 RepID=A0A922A7W4_CARIL|nr:hypothetical protein I3842_16G093700 [Carya illinoinensis]